MNNKLENLNFKNCGMLVVLTHNLVASRLSMNKSTLFTNFQLKNHLDDVKESLILLLNWILNLLNHQILLLLVIIVSDDEDDVFETKPPPKRVKPSPVTESITVDSGDESYTRSPLKDVNNNVFFI